MGSLIDELARLAGSPPGRSLGFNARAAIKEAASEITRLEQEATALHGAAAEAQRLYLVADREALDAKREITRLRGEVERLTAPASRDEWVLVPREPTEAMIDACGRATGYEETGALCYRAMVASILNFTPADHQATHAALVNEAERLRGALREIVSECRNGGYPNEIVATRMIERIEETACEALAKPETAG